MTAHRSLSHPAPARFRRAFGLTAASVVALGVLASPVFAADGDAFVSRDEAAVAKAPQNAAARAELGRTYLKAGRFESAAAALADAQALGDGSGRTALNLALAETAIGKGHDALEVLDAARAQLPVPDFGLAVALAGDSSRGVAVLLDDLRSGDKAPNLRQNLAYAYALDGRWGDARVAASMDLSIDKVDGRLTQWAATAQPEAYRQRVAALLGAPVRDDSGMPSTLALNAPAAAPAQAAPAQLAAIDTPAAAPAPVAAPVVAEAAPAPVAPAAVQVAVVEPIPAAVEPVAVLSSAKPVQHPRTRLPKAVAAKPVALAVARSNAPVVNGGKVLQLGAFTSEQNAERARKQFAHSASLTGHSFAITQAVVNGRNFWRVTVSGFNTASAEGTCGAIRRHGGACFAHAGEHPGGQALAMADNPRKH